MDRIERMGIFEEQVEQKAERQALNYKKLARVLRRQGYELVKGRIVHRSKIINLTQNMEVK